ncbi:MAG: 50S ribosomal protein L29 [bacterium]|nr:50S ribosomal protein L29 [bacterium]
MKRKDSKELRGLEDQDLGKESLQAKKALSNLVFENHQGHVKNTAEIRSLRRYIARCQTILREREIAVS